MVMTIGEDGSSEESKTSKRISERQLLHGRLADRRTERHTEREEKMGPLLPSLQGGQTWGIYTRVTDEIRDKYFMQKNVSSGKK